MGIKFNSQICTTREQSKRLLDFGLKKETADMVLWYQNDFDGYEARENDWQRYECIHEHIPAWSLHRLIEMMPDLIKHDEMLYHQTIDVHGIEYDNRYNEACQFLDGTLFDNIISCIEWLIEWGHFNEKYLV